MRNTCAVFRRSSETDAKDVVGIIACDVEMLCSGFVMLQSNRIQLQLLDMARLFNGRLMSIKV
jgi:hypothetical protein